MATSQSPLLVIINPVSGQKDGESSLAQIVSYLDDAGADYEIRKTEKEGDAKEWARESDGFSRVIVAGGDGTIMEAMSGTVDNPHKIPLAQIPLGTANLLARALAVPLEIPEAMELALKTGVATKMDVGFLPSHDRHFAIVAGAGWDAEMIDDADREMKNKLGFFAYVVTGIKHIFDLKKSDITVTIDGERSEFNAQSLMVINVGEIYGSGIALGEDVSPYDGKLNLAIAAPKNPAGVLRLLFRVLTKRYEGSHDLRYFSGQEIKVEADPPMKLELDGDTIGETPFEARVIPSGACLIVPKKYAETKKVEFEELPSCL